MTLSDAMVHRFFKDFQISLPVERANFLNYYVNDFDEYFKMKEKLFMFMECRMSFDTDEDFYQHRNELVGEVLEYIENHPDYIKFNTSEDSFDDGLLLKGASKKIFTDDNVGKKFLSIDLKCGNFTALKHFSKELVKNCETWQEFMLTFSNFRYFGETKHLRQSLLGKLNNKRILKYERMLLEKEVISHVLMTSSLSVKDVVCHNFDEVIFEVNDIKENNIDIPDSFKNDVHVEVFELKKIEPYSMYIKESKSGIKLKCVDLNLFPQVYKYVTKQPLCENDLYFISNQGLLAKYIERFKFEV